MKIEKFMCDVTKALVNEKRVHFMHCGNDVFISTDGYFGMILPENLNIFNHEIRGNFEIPRDWEEYRMKALPMSEYHGKKLCRVFQPVSGNWTTLIDEKFLKYFDMCVAQFYQTKENGCVFVRESENICAVVMPIRNVEVK
nr:MAG TPA: hypothetical protein [Caudoviricetes sp.]